MRRERSTSRPLRLHNFFLPTVGAHSLVLVSVVSSRSCSFVFFSCLLYFVCLFRVRFVCVSLVRSCPSRLFVFVPFVCVHLVHLFVSIVFVSFIRSCSSHSFVRVPLIHSLVFVSFVRLTIVVSHARLPFSEDAFSSRKEEDEGEPMLFRVVFFSYFLPFPRCPILPFYFFPRFVNVL